MGRKSSERSVTRRCSRGDRSANHGRKLELEYADGTNALALLEQGFGYWRIVGNSPRYDFRVPPAAQASELYWSSAAASGMRESYLAVTKRAS